MFLDFEKWHGAKNDFAVTWISDLDGDLVLNSLKRQAAKLCDRHGGIGADGVLVLQTKKPRDLTPYKLTIINSDGSVAMNCGNGLRCVAASVRKRHRDHGDPNELPEAVELEVEGAAKICRFLKQTGEAPLVAVEMGVPQVGDDVPWRRVAEAAVASVMDGHGPYEIGVCTIGNPHVVITTDAASHALMLKVGPALQKAGPWDGVNVHVVKSRPLEAKDQARAGHELGAPLAELFTAFVWERGAGETQACGSGVCAIAAVSLATGLVERDAWVGVDMPGGRLYARWEDDAEPAVLAGPAAFVYAGKIEV